MTSDNPAPKVPEASNTEPSSTARRPVPAPEALVAGAVAALGFIVAGMFRGTFPFGGASRSTNDLGAQYVPFFAHLWDVLTGNAQGDLLFNWQSGFGVGFLADYGIDLGSPLSLLVVLFPRDDIDLAVFVITTLKLALAAAAMAALLRRMRPGPWWLAAVLGASYGLCGWAIDDGAYVPMWLDGLIALPMFCLVGEWSLKRKHRILSVAVIAVFWVSNFYTAYMATIAAGLIVLVRVLTSETSWLDRLRGLLRYALASVLGLALSAPILIPLFKANSLATPSPSGTFTPVPLENFFSRLLPLSEGVGRGASLYVGTAALLLAATLPFNGSVRAVTRIAWTLLAVLVGASFLWKPTHELWHGFDIPNGSQYRQGFVLCAILVIAAWLSVADRAPSWIALTGGTALVVTLAIYTQHSPLLTNGSIIVLSCSGALILLVLLAMRYAGRPRLVSLVAAVVVIGAVGVELAWTAIVVDQQRNKFLTASAPAWGAEQTDRADKVHAAAGWPQYRTNPGTALTPNDPILLGGQGPGYYSSILPASLNHTLTDLGFGWVGYGRASHDLDNPVTDAIFAIGARFEDGTIKRTEVPPLVTVHPKPADGAAQPDSVFAFQERLLGADVYEVPEYKGRRTAEPGVVTMTARCAPGSTVYLNLPRASGEARVGQDAEWQPLTASRRPGITTSSGLLKIGQTPASGVAVAEIKILAATGRLPVTGAMGCLDSEKLTKAVAALREAGATEVKTGGHSIDATLKPGSTGLAVVSVPRIEGWSCSVDGGKKQEPTELGGLLAVQLPGPSQKISCSFQPPGLGIGLAAGGGAFLITLGLALISLRRRRKASAS
ncbi:YfhO family protein [Streptomyces sp. SID13031]|uniref:YfhO family protein n=1 Tax=Streptomyces sp. SID13031 TaxID=2706046 RepID=UPI0013CD5260|nr:YfhO family protein [Streptomyces sp. SID13031]NEA31779.1 YfhO family protein [Streptomyces sp. SID13031]